VSRPSSHRDLPVADLAGSQGQATDEHVHAVEARFLELNEARRVFMVVPRDLREDRCQRAVDTTCARIGSALCSWAS